MSPTLPDLGILRRCWSGFVEAGSTRTVEVGQVVIGGGRPVVIGGPCAVESLEQTLEIAEVVRDAGGQILRGGAYKPRTNPHSFLGLGRHGLEILAEARRVTGLPFVTEVLDPRRVEEVASFADMLQIGSRSMHNYPLLTEVGRAGRPVLLKRGWSATLEEWLCAAEYVAKEGNDRIVLCERGIRSAVHWSYAQSVLDLNVLQPAREATPLPLIVDPSHATGHWKLVAAMSRAALAAGAHGLLVEVVAHGVDRAALSSDAMQGVPPRVFAEIVAAAEATR
ncbi:MAG TPA: 3-deoxy-7-phosphoheptulonate synthase [Candidatus Polarisedimenticolaceae bacterium]|nr:3-deoxy-7-phosphoheptulonate synthase [Candidatus Polarisedimenticolaceae bacterium]